MSERVVILSNEPAFAQMLRLELEDAGYTVSVLRRDSRLAAAGVYLVDRDAFFDVAPPASRVVGYGRVTRKEACFLSRPFLLSALLPAVRGEEEITGTLKLQGDGVLILPNGTRVLLSPKEYALLACLVRADGAPVPRAKLLREVWGEGQSEGVVTVYLHYLRKKLERDGKKMLYAVRGSGYALRWEDKG